MKRALSAVLISSSLLLLATGTARAEDQEILTLKTLCEHGAWEEAKDYADQIAQAKPDALGYKAWALAGLSKQTNNAKLLDEAKKIGKTPKGLNLEQLPPNKFGTPDFEIQFAWTQKNRGRLAAAEACLDAAIKNGFPAPRDMLTAKTLRGTFWGDRSWMLPEAPKRKEAFDKAKALFLEVAETAGAPGETVVEARYDLYDLLYSRGERLLEMGKRQDDLAQQDAYKKEALEQFKAGVAFLEPECKRLREAIDKASAPAADPGKEPKEGAEPPAPSGKKPDDFALMFANYFWPKCLVGQARCIADKAEHDSLVNKAVEIYSNYNLDFGGEPQGKEAAIDMSEAYREIGNEEMANVSLDSALSIEQDSPDFDRLHGTDPKKPLRIGGLDANGKFIADPQSFDIFARASNVKGKALKKRGDWKKALATYDKVFADAKVSGIEFEKEPLGKLLTIERAEALARDGKAKDAKADLDKLIKEDESGPTGQAARAMLARVASGGGGGGGEDVNAGVNADRALALMDEALGKNELGNASNYSRLAIRRAKEEGKTSDIIPKALIGLGKVYGEQGRYYEAAIAYEEVIAKFGDSKVAGQAAQEAVNCYLQLKSRVPNEHDKGKYDSSLKVLTDKYPNEGKGFGDYLLGRELQEENKYDEAAKYFEKVPPEAGEMYDKSLYTASVCRFALAQQQLKEKKDAKQLLSDTAANLRKTIETLGKNDGISDDRKRSRKDLDAEARFLLANVLLTDTINKPEDVLPLFEHASTDFEGNPDRLSHAGEFRINADLKLKRYDAAESELKVLLEQFKGNKRTIRAAKDVAAAMDRDLEDGIKNKSTSPEDRRKKRKRIAAYYARWILDGLESQDSQPRVAEVKSTANRLFLFALDIAGVDETLSFFSEMDDNFDPGEAKQTFTDARDIYAKLCTPDNLKNMKSAWELLTSYGEAAGFVKDWPTCQKGLEDAIADGKLIKNNQLDLDLLQKRETQPLLTYYFDLGKCFESLGATDKANYQKAIDVFTNVLGASVEGSRNWWRAKYEYYKCLEGRGEANDFKELGVAIKALERKYPDFKDAGKHGMQEKFQKLKTELDAKGIK
jgi:hypothetical protein